MTFELSKQFRFEAAHTLCRAVDGEASRRIHGHSYRAEVVVRGQADPTTGMVIDLGLLQPLLEEVRAGLDHQFLDEIPDLGAPTMENLSLWIWRKIAPACSGLSRVAVFRDSTGEMCTYFGPGQEGVR